MLLTFIITFTENPCESLFVSIRYKHDSPVIANVIFSRTIIISSDEYKSKTNFSSLNILMKCIVRQRRTTRTYNKPVHNATSYWDTLRWKMARYLQISRRQLIVDRTCRVDLNKWTVVIPRWNFGHDRPLLKYPSVKFSASGRLLPDFGKFTYRANSRPSCRNPKTNR